MDLDILDRYESRSNNLRHAAVLWAGGAVTPRTAVADLPEAKLPMRIDLHGLVSTSIAVRALLREAATRIEKRRNEVLAQGNDACAGSVLVDHLAELAKRYQDAAFDASDHHRTWLAEPGCQPPPLYPVRQHEPDVPQVAIHPDATVYCFDIEQGIPNVSVPFVLGRIDGYRRCHPTPRFWPAVDGPEPTDSDEPVIERRHPTIDHPVVRDAFEDQWHDHVSAWLAGAWKAGRIRLTPHAAVYLDARPGVQRSG